MRLFSNERLRWIFIGSNGIRAGWSVLLFVAILGAVGGTLGFVVRHFHHFERPAGEVAPLFLAIREAASISLVLGATAVMGRIEHQSVLTYGLGGTKRLAKFMAGCAGGLLSLSAVIGLLYAGGYLAVDGLALHGAPILGFGLAWLFVFFLVGVSEEIVFRGYVQATLTRGMGFWPAAVVMSLLFAAAHTRNQGETVLGVAEVFTAGMVLCLLLRVTGSLWMSIGFHTAWDWAQSFLYGVPDSALMMKGHLLVTHAVGNAAMSGGTAGPEGSVLAPLGLVLGPVGLVWLSRRLGLVTGGGEKEERKEAVLF